MFYLKKNKEGNWEIYISEENTSLVSLEEIKTSIRTGYLSENFMRVDSETWHLIIEKDIKKPPLIISFIDNYTFKAIHLTDLFQNFFSTQIEPDRSKDKQTVLNFMTSKIEGQNQKTITGNKKRSEEIICLERKSEEIYSSPNSHFHEKPPSPETPRIPEINNSSKVEPPPLVLGKRNRGRNEFSIQKNLGTTEKKPRKETKYVFPSLSYDGKVCIFSAPEDKTLLPGNPIFSRKLEGFINKKKEVEAIPKAATTAEKINFFEKIRKFLNRKKNINTKYIHATQSGFFLEEEAFKPPDVRISKYLKKFLKPGINPKDVFKENFYLIPSLILTLEEYLNGTFLPKKNTSENLFILENIKCLDYSYVFSSKQEIRVNLQNRKPLIISGKILVKLINQETKDEIKFTAESKNDDALKNKIKTTFNVNSISLFFKKLKQNLANLNKNNSRFMHQDAANLLFAIREEWFNNVTLLPYSETPLQQEQTCTKTNPEIQHPNSGNSNQKSMNTTQIINYHNTAPLTLFYTPPDLEALTHTLPGLETLIPTQEL